MKIIATYICLFKSNNSHFDDEYYKVHELEAGYYIKEDWRGRLSKISIEEFKNATII